MNKDTLVAQRKQAEDAFNELAKQKKDIEDEMNCRRGEYRAYTKLIELAEENEVKPAEVKTKPKKRG